MKKIIALFAVAVLWITFAVAGNPSESAFGKYFERKSMRIDYELTGDRASQSASLKLIREEPFWAGPAENLIDGLGRGGYYANVYDKASGELIYSRGFNTLFEEWRTTAQAATERQSWTNSISIPYPKGEIVFELTARRPEDMGFTTLMTVEIDPRSVFIDRSRLADNEVRRIVYNGAPGGKVDLVFLAEGYTAPEMDKFYADAGRFVEAMFAAPPFDTHRDDFNVWAVGLRSDESGVDFPHRGVFRNTALNSGFNTFGSERYLTTPDMKSIRDAVWNVPCDAIFILANTDVYGGGGMYNMYAIGSSDNAKTLEVFLHEFGHSLGGLADEYYTSEVAYEAMYSPDVEPWEPNITTLADFDSKWKDMLAPGTPVPTPLTPEYRGGVGVFEGGGYSAKGIYRPSDHCMMRDLVEFCPVCRREITKVIDFLCGREY